MRDLTVYDSQGAPLDGGHGAVNERIKDFFFGGVRVALETVGNGYKLTAFFRARDSSASRSEQYYGVLETADEGELSNFSEIIENHLQTEYGKELVTTKEDTTVFEELGGGTLRSAPGDRETRNDIAELVNEGEQALVGVGSYEEATTLLTSYLGEINNPRIAIAENAQSSTLSDYGLVIEKGSYTGLELLGDTEERIEEMKERKRRQREQMLGGPTGAGPYGQQQQSGPFGLGTRALAGVVAGGVLLLLVLASVGACFIGVSVPVAGSLIPMDCGGGGGDGGPTGPAGPVVNIETAMVLQNSSQSFLQIEGTLTENGSSPSDGSATFRYLVNKTDNESITIADGTQSTNVKNGDFTLNLSETIENESYDVNGSYRVTLEWRNANTTVSVPLETESGSSTPSESDGTPTGSTPTDGEQVTAEEETTQTQSSTPA